jgi:hypothetical protein
MSKKTGFRTTKIIETNIPNTQPSGNWVGNSIPITYLNKGIYLCNYNLGIQSNGGATLLAMTVAVTSVLEWTDVNSNIIISTPATGNLVTAPNQPVYQSCSNVFTVDTNNTPIFLMINCNVDVGSWGTTLTQSNQNNIILFTRLGNV